MKVILLNNIPALGKKFNVVNVKDGHALNYLFPNKLAKLATDQDLKDLNMKKQKAMIKQEEMKTFEKEIAKRISDLGKLKFQKKTSAKNTLFASITEKDVASELKNVLQIELTPHNVTMKEHIKVLGEHVINIRVGEINTHLTVVVEKSE